MIQYTSFDVIEKSGGNPLNAIEELWFTIQFAGKYNMY
jgi:hypothetical protein